MDGIENPKNIYLPLERLYLFYWTEPAEKKEELMMIKRKVLVIHFMVIHSNAVLNMHQMYATGRCASNKQNSVPF